MATSVKGRLIFSHWGYYWDDGKENGQYHNIGVIVGLYAWQISFCVPVIVDVLVASLLRHEHVVAQISARVHLQGMRYIMTLTLNSRSSYTERKVFWLASQRNPVKSHL